MLYFECFDLGSYKSSLDKMLPIIESSRHILIIGNGGSSTIASHVSVDLLLLGYLASALNDPSVLTALTNDFCYEEVYSRQIKVWPAGGVLIAISSSGSSKNIVNGANTAKDKGYTVLTFSGFSPDNNLNKIGDVNIHVPYNDYGIVESSHSVLLHYLINELKG